MATVDPFQLRVETTLMRKLRTEARQRAISMNALINTVIRLYYFPPNKDEDKILSILQEVNNNVLSIVETLKTLKDV